MKVKEEYMTNLLMTLHQKIITETKAKTTKKIKALIITRNIKDKFLKSLTNSTINVVRRVKK